ncbi:TPR domain-containing glycosyltransferase [Petroclostridium sp. X23]|uniref:tetratricopeptide repeat-containing glycosyltransferase family 2 protein n=1 Tax=Petroclostridium sp. X23 TaxID=3045146 RepID=UPI0024AC9056|nr:TPR domain-containing glycosyltransferase [Petroclostridium sp. X23]WHH58247.1 tetratricopeptide repeat protein [Petroclostridium sp. X23]
MERKKTVSLCMIVKNEERYLEKCLKSVKGLVDEMIIVDTGSTDRTVEIAGKMDAIIKHYKWDNSFSNARNFSLQHASKDWILLMDGDDEFNKEHYDKFIRLVNTSVKDGHFFKTLSFTGEKPGKDIVSNLNLRLLKNNKKYRFAGAIHEQLTRVNGKLDYNDFSSEDIEIFHYGYLSNVAVEKNKRERNISIIEEELKKDPYNRFHLFNLGNEYFALGDQRKALELFDRVYGNLNFNAGYSSKLVIRRIMCFDELREYSNALKAIEEGLKAYPQFTDLELIRGHIYFKNKQYISAIESFKKCIELGPTPIQLEFLDGCGTYRPYQALGEVYLQIEDYQKAFECFENVLRINPSLQSSVYRIGKILNILYENKRYVSYRLSQYFNLEYVPNLLLIAGVLISEGLYDIAMGYLEKARDLDKNNSQVNFLLGTNLFYQKKGVEAVKIFTELPEKSSEYQESLKYIFISSLTNDLNHIQAVINRIKQSSEDFLYRIYLQLYNVFLGKEEVILLEEDDHDKILKTTLEIVAELLKIQEFDTFEKLLNVLNVINSNKVLLELGKLYYNYGFKQMAVNEILRSIKELSAIDPAGVEILYKEIR